MGKFSSYSGSGFHMTFDNGYTISVQWGYGSYTENQYNYNVVADKYRKYTQAEHAEIAVFDSRSNEFMNPSDYMGVDYDGDDEVVGWVPADEVAAIIYHVANLG